MYNNIVQGFFNLGCIAHCSLEVCFHKYSERVVFKSLFCVKKISCCLQFNLFSYMEIKSEQYLYLLNGISKS